MLIKNALPFENLLADLQRHGFVIGLDHHLRLQAMLAALDGRCMPSDIKSLLCPIFAASEQQQQLFYSLFDHHFSIFSSATAAPPALKPVDTASGERKTSSQRRGNRTPRIVLLLVAVIVSSLFFWLRRAPTPQPQLPLAEAPANAAIEPQPAQSEPGLAPQPLTTTPAPGSTAVPSQQPATSFPTTLVFAILIVVIPAAWFLIGEVARWRRRRLVLQRQEGLLPPHSWPMRLQGTGVPLYSSPAFYTAARWLHTRQTGDGMDLDVGGTIDATIRGGGFTAFHYYRRTRLPDYLVLIDRASFRDHQAQLFDSLAAALHEEGLFLERLFYEGDPRECWTQESDRPLSLIELQRRYPEHRLLLFGDGTALLNPVSGQLAAWTEVFSSWKEKAVLSPLAMTEWGIRERRLAGQFLVLPATQEGLQALGYYFRSAQSADGSWPRGGERPVILDTPADLRELLGADAFTWLCACAVYPELHWDLTLHIACLASLPPGLVTEENLLKLVRLPWFRTGSMPDDLRNQLIRELTPAQEREVRSAVIEMLSKTPAPEGTIAADRQQMEIVLQRYFLSRQEGASVRRLRRILEEVPENLRRYYVALRSTELAVPSPLDFLLPPAFRKIVFVDGHSWLGIRGMTRVAATLAVIGLGFYALMVTESFLGNRRLQQTALAAAAAIKFDNASAPPIPSLRDLTKLDALRQSVETIGRYNREGPPLSYRWGLYVGEKIYPTVRRLYFQRFFQLLFSSTQAGVVSKLQTLPARPGPTDTYQYPYDTLKSYLITTSNHDKSTKLYLSPVLYSRWEMGKSVDAARSQLVRKQFDFYSEELKFANPFSSENDSAAIDRARKYLAQFAGAERVYRSMLAEANTKARSLNFNQEFPGSAQTVVNNRDVAGAYTKTGWPIMQDAIRHADRYISGEQWVLGDQSANFGDFGKLQDDLRMLYVADFTQQWQEYLKRSVVVAYSDIPDAAKKLAMTSGPQSPLLEMFCMASQSVGIDPDIAKSFKAVLTVVPASCGDTYVGGPNQDYMKALSTLQVSLGQIASPDPNDPNVAAAANNAQFASVVAAQMARGFGADPLAPTVEKLSEDPIANVEPKLKGMGAADLNNGGKSLCTDFRALMSKYPFNPQSTNEAGLTDVNMMFKPGEGSIWKFYDQKLQKLLPKQGNQYVPVAGGSVTLLPGFVAFFNRMAAFSNALYAGGRDPHFTYSLHAVQTEGIQSATLNIDGQTVTSANGGAAKQFTWPGTQAGVRATNKFAGGPDLTWAAYPGLWGVFKFFERADTPAGPGARGRVEWFIRAGDQLVTLPDGKPLTVRVDLDMGASPPVFQRGYFSNLSCVADVAGGNTLSREVVPALPRSPDVNAGTLIVSTGEDDVHVFINNKDVGRRTQHGQLRIQTLGPVSVRVAKDGFDMPPAQVAEVKKGGETRLEFKLKASPQFATLQIAGGTPGAQVLIDQRSLGTVGPDGNFSNGTVAPGDHAIEIRRDQYVPHRLQRTFRAGQTVTIAGADAILVANPPILAPAPSPTPKVGTMQDWEDPTAWKMKDGIWLHQGMGFIPYKLPPNGVFTFTMQLVKSGGIFRDGKIRWVLNYIDNRNYALFELDNQNFTASVVVMGRVYQRTKIPLKDLEQQKSLTIQIDVTPQYVVQKMFTGGEWINLDSWAETGRNFSEGKFGFLIQGVDEIGLSDFSFTPR